MVDKTLFRKQAPRAMRELIQAFSLTVLDAAAIMGNAGHESNGLTTLQEEKPVVPGSRGGYGWFQWTGPRRRTFETWAGVRGFKLDSYEANIGFLLNELRGSENQALVKLRLAVGLEAKVQAFERGYERAGIKHYSGRVNWAKEALAAYEGKQAPVVKKSKVNNKPLSRSRTMGGAGAVAVGGAVETATAIEKATDELTRADGALSSGTIIGLILGVLIVVGAAVALYARWDDAGRPVPWGEKE